MGPSLPAAIQTPGSPPVSAASLALAVDLHRRGDLPAAERAYRAVLAEQPGNHEAACLLAQIRQQCGRLAEAVAFSGRAVAVRDDLPVIHTIRADALAGLGRHREALAHYDRALERMPALHWAHLNRGNALARLGRAAEALRSYRQALLLEPADADTHLNLGNVLAGLGRRDDALAGYGRALQVSPGLVEAHLNRGVLHAHRDPHGALANCDRLLRIAPNLAEAHMSRAGLLLFLMRPRDALAGCERALGLRPDLAEAHLHRADALSQSGRIGEALSSYARALALDPNFDEAVVQTAYLRLVLCDWASAARDRTLLTRMVAEGRRVDPFIFRSADASPAQQLDCATAARRVYRAEPGQAFRPRGGPVRIGYLSSDFSEHPVAALIVEVLEAHDRDRFEISAYCTAPAPEGPMRQRIRSSVDRFVELHAMSDVQAAARIRQDGIDILVDLNGFTRGARPDILARRPAPIQASYLGYVGTSGTDFVDYVIADAFSVGAAQRSHYTETVIELPGSYLPIPEHRRVAPVLSRADYGLSDSGIVFCCFNNTYKIAPAMFGAWMAVLAAVPGSVLWLCSDNPAAIANLRKEARARGVDPDRLVFAPRAPVPDYLARLRAADLFLDTTPCSACTLASDALSMGLPIVTLAGGTFAGRHAGSLLTALGLPDLIAGTLEDYVALARMHTARPDRIAGLKARLKGRLAASAGMGGRAFAAGLEAAFLRMVEARPAAVRRGEA